MNHSTIIGLSGGLVLLIGMAIMSPEHIGAFLNIPGLIVVLGGTLTATFVSRPIKDVYQVLRSLPELFGNESNTINRDIKQLLQFARCYRYNTPRVAERELTAIHNEFLSASLRRVVDGDSLEDILKSMRWRISGMRSSEQSKVQILNTMAVFAPAFGMLGTLFGLVHMLSGLGNSGLDEIGSTMAFAMITTVYGIIVSNLFFKPLAIKMERRVAQKIMQLSALMEGVMQVYQKRHPTLIKETMEAFYTHHDTQTIIGNHLTLVQET